ncbi:bifunctional phosphoribosylaminoimidazolecarboxamide formyltransferase/IMP cyclohydrolase [Georgenia yuyongxinii]|uniref:Bifunctional purine biosynthesis protein PurH n=1 Tax=Georgenia yuyongxinii TaxID=2589797 RepID=A0A552WKS9_9MICO|nr:bifunctional phosphoribosylaminoimidazolecarboxamide formyltransferase/IMP cyclohydrolase [Georgenia yuyongxinii]TRW43083.1 bifunctional phosphoribosylaminoimidazolecarboxamide formyltransferase/IMP cyclohydrolase [Georgenia yuyongxinii]
MSATAHPVIEPVGDQVPVRRALVSVYDKTGLEELATALHDAGVQIVSTGSTAKTIAAAGVAVTGVEDVTGFPECLDGRVKTLHPRIHAGVLADRRLATHREELTELGVEPFDLVVVNLYPFTETVASGAGVDECVEQIDIGGPTMVRAAAKNHPSVAVVVDPARYDDVAAAVAGGGFTLAQRRRLAVAAFEHTAAYDVAVASWMSGVFDEEPDGGADAGTAGSAAAGAGEQPAAAALPGFTGGAWVRRANLRYGENPHQRAALYTADGVRTGIAGAEQLHGKAMSYNNYVDADAAVRAAYDHDGPAVAIIKHANPCGIGTGADVAEAHRKAHACDPVSAYGGVVAANRPVTAAMAEQVAPVFTEVVAAPAFEPEALEILTRKKNVRLLVVDPGDRGGVDLRPISGGVLAQDRDAVDAPGDTPAGWTLMAGAAADERTLADLTFAWRAVRAVRSNAILLADDGASVGVGMGQVNRVDSCRLAVERANTLGAAVDSAVDAAGGAENADAAAQAAAPARAQGAVAASDAFFPFADGLQVLIDAGVRAVVHPGGSIRDDEVIAAANAAGITMYHTGTRHFAH